MTLLFVNLLFIFQISFSYLYARADGVQDNITFHRLNYKNPPLRDYWHLQKHIARVSIFSAGGCFFAAIVLIILFKAWLGLLIIPVFFVTLWPLKIIWNEYGLSSENTYYNKDENMHITTHNAWLDKQLGFHW